MSDDHELDVWVEGRYAGVLTRRDDAVTFVYDPGYRQQRYSPALSVSMPKNRAEHGGDPARRWIDNLLPDNEDVRERWAADFGERRAAAFDLLWHMGQDCAGAVQVMPSGIAPETTGDGQPIGEDVIEARLRALRRDEEDACQALGLSRAVKYESDGGPGVAAIRALLARAVDVRDLRVSKELFAAASAYPALALPPDEVHVRSRLAIKIGGHYTLRDIQKTAPGAGCSCCRRRPGTAARHSQLIRSRPGRRRRPGS